MSAFCLARGPFTEQDLAWKRQSAIVGGDPLPYGSAANRRALEHAARLAYEQHLTPEMFHHDRPVVKPARQRNRNRGERLVENARAEVGGERKLADVELELADHSTVRRDLRFDANMLQLDAVELDFTVE